MIYIIHFDEPLAHARHYIGFVQGDADEVAARLAEHRAGWGARIFAECNRRGIGYDVVATLPGDRTEERRLKNYHKGSQICPICSPSKTKPAISPLPSGGGVRGGARTP